MISVIGEKMAMGRAVDSGAAMLCKNVTIVQPLSR